MIFERFSSLNVKVIGIPLGSIGKPIIDGDGDGRCFEENGESIPCPPE